MKQRRRFRSTHHDLRGPFMLEGKDAGLTDHTVLETAHERNVRRRRILTFLIVLAIAALFFVIFWFFALPRIRAAYSTPPEVVIVDRTVTATPVVITNLLPLLALLALIPFISWALWKMTPNEWLPEILKRKAPRNDDEIDDDESENAIESITSPSVAAAASQKRSAAGAPADPATGAPKPPPSRPVSAASAAPPPGTPGTPIERQFTSRAIAIIRDAIEKSGFEEVSPTTEQLLQNMINNGKTRTITVDFETIFNHLDDPTRFKDVVAHINNGDWGKAEQAMRNINAASPKMFNRGGAKAIEAYLAAHPDAIEPTMAHQIITT